MVHFLHNQHVGEDKALRDVPLQQCVQRTDYADVLRTAVSFSNGSCLQSQPLGLWDAVAVGVR